MTVDDVIKQLNRSTVVDRILNVVHTHNETINKAAEQIKMHLNVLLSTKRQIQNLLYGHFNVTSRPAD